jgi:hypothetical protein
MSVEFRERLMELPREELLAIIKDQDSELMKQVRRIEWVFENKMTHLTWEDGTQILGRPIPNEDLALLIDEPFSPDKSLIRAGIDIDQQQQIHVASDPVLWAKHFLKATPRAYQIMMLRHPSLRKVLRAGRRLGKTWTMAVVLLHYSFTHNDGRCIVVAPMKSQAELIYQEIIRLTKKSDVVFNSITRKVTSPQFMIEFSNGSTIRFFTSGIRSGGKADVVRGQEAHLIILDELDYMHGDDLESLYAMLQKTAEDQPDKLLMGASTPTGRREQFWQWCHSPRFKEFWFPSYVNPFFTKDAEDEFRAQYTEMGYRHEIEADWGEDVDGVYPRKYVDMAFANDGWPYRADITSARSFFVVGVDWDKYGAGTNMVVLEVCDKDYEDPQFAGKIKLVYREETQREEYTLTNAVQRIIELNKIFNPRHIYVDRGFGEVQVELLHKYGIEHPETQLRKRVVGVSFSETIEIRDPHTKMPVKKDLKPFMVDNLRQLLEKQQIVFPKTDDEVFRDNSSLYLQLISYVVARTTQLGRPVFEASGTAQDHAHDALILACLAITQNYGDLMRANIARRAIAINNETFLPVFKIEDENDQKIAEQTWGENINDAPVEKKRNLSVRMNKRNPYRPIRRKMF